MGGRWLFLFDVLRKAQARVLSALRDCVLSFKDMLRLDSFTVAFRYLVLA